MIRKKINNLRYIPSGLNNLIKDLIFSLNMMVHARSYIRENSYCEAVEIVSDVVYYSVSDHVFSSIKVIRENSKTPPILKIENVVVSKLNDLSRDLWETISASVSATGC